MKILRCFVFLMLVAPARGEVAGFKETVEPFLENYCLDCHDEATMKGKISLEDLSTSFVGPDLEMWRMISDQLIFHEMPPKKKDQPEDAERTAVLDWIRGELLKTQHPLAEMEEKLREPAFGNYVDHEYLFGERREFVMPGKPRIWRMRPEIYEATMVNVANVSTSLANGLSLVDAEGFKDYAAPYFVDEASTSTLLGNAKNVTEKLLEEKSREGALKALVHGGKAPSREVVENAVKSAFDKILMRSATVEEVERFAAFHAKAQETGGYELAGPALVTAILMQPEAIYREELAEGTGDAQGRSRLTPREAAYALSYALGNEPLKEFFDAKDDLHDPMKVAELIRERLKDSSDDYMKNPRVMGFFREYFGYMNALEVFKDKPEGGKHEPAWLIADLEMVITDILKEDKDVLANLLTKRKYYVNAKWGGKDNPGEIVIRDPRRYTYPTAFNLPVDWKWSAKQQPVEFAKSERAGVLTHPAWLAAWSGNFDNHPVQRGKWIRFHLLGGTVPDVPIGVDARVPEMDHTTFRDRLRMVTKEPECWRCHRNMDPLGVPLERYDHYGRYQRLDAGQPVVASGAITRTLVPEIHEEVAGPTEMMDALAKSEFVQQVFIRHIFRYYMGRNETLGDANTMQDAFTAYEENDGSFNEALVSILSSDSFLMRQSAKK